MASERTDESRTGSGGEEPLSETLVELAKRRGFFFGANDAYGGTAGFYVYGPHGASLKENVEDAWRDRYVTREGHMEIDAPTIMPEASKTASGMIVGASISWWPSRTAKRSRQASSRLRLSVAPCGPNV